MPASKSASSDIPASRNSVTSSSRPVLTPSAVRTGKVYLTVICTSSSITRFRDVSPKACVSMSEPSSLRTSARDETTSCDISVIAASSSPDSSRKTYMSRKPSNISVSSSASITLSACRQGKPSPSAPAVTSASITSAASFLCAMWSGDSPKPSSTLASAPAATRICTNSLDPFSAAILRGVL